MPALRRQWILLAAAFVLLLAAGYWRLAAELPDAWRWLVLAALIGGYQLAVLRADLALNRAAGERLRPNWGAGTWLSSLRLIALSLLAGFLPIPRPGGELAWLPFWLALVFNVADLFDGYLARKSGGSTLLGAKLDLDLDGRGMLVASLLVVRFGQAGAWFALAGLARYLYVAALWARKRAGRTLAPLADNPLRRPFAGVEMGVATASLAPVFAPAVTNFVATLTLLPFLSNFVWDWLQVTRHVPAAAFGRAAPRSRSLIAAATLLLRAAVAAALLWRAWQFGVTTLAGTVDLVAGLYLLLGLAGRPTALIALIATGLRIGFAAPQPLDTFLLFGLTALAYLGSGPWRLWEPERGLVRSRLGEKKG
jgi:CDP-diacylglycerol--glycerol-3-phosphate 3-phosphatidyltransferase